MTRRKFIDKFIKTGLAIAAGVWWRAKATSRKFVRALRPDRYPGPLKPLKDIDKQGKWSG